MLTGKGWKEVNERCSNIGCMGYYDILFDLEGIKMDYIKNIPESCAECPKYIYKGDDEQLCQASRMREMHLKRWQKKPKWCPIEKRFRNEK